MVSAACQATASSSQRTLSFHLRTDLVWASAQHKQACSKVEQVSPDGTAHRVGHDLRFLQPA
jgi:hypothetical protein